MTRAEASALAIALDKAMQGLDEVVHLARSYEEQGEHCSGPRVDALRALNVLSMHRAFLISGGGEVWAYEGGESDEHRTLTADECEYRDAS